MTTLEVLRAARELIEDPEHWTTGNTARNAEGETVDPGGPEAVCWCVMGAIHRVAALGMRDRWAARDALDAAARGMLEPGVDPDDLDACPEAYINDHSDHATALAMFDRAIQVAEEGQGAGVAMKSESVELRTEG